MASMQQRAVAEVDDPVVSPRSAITSASAPAAAIVSPLTATASTAG